MDFTLKDFSTASNCLYHIRFSVCQAQVIYSFKLGRHENAEADFDIPISNDLMTTQDWTVKLVYALTTAYWALL